ncbi:hypothetical protein AALP_AAs48002U000400 [Arabis alpina]|uniref:Uncharacterized protein n=1 Tax=Arabis alpina TaxID=50452 RepID=A0A087FYR7_ARAAL|nr:hypothetical protein AALP_AAs48002U000400 [Arabis alpina]
MQQKAWRVFERAKGKALHHQKMCGHAHLLARLNTCGSSTYTHQY